LPTLTLRPGVRDYLLLLDESTHDGKTCPLSGLGGEPNG
jgi:hypothetical protein